MLRKIFAVVMLVSASILAFNQANPAPIPESVKAHHKTLYSSYFNQNLNNIDQETNAGRDVNFDVGINVHYAMAAEGIEESRKNPYPDMVLRGLSCQADAVVIAVPKVAEASMTADQRGLFTDSRFKVESVLKNTSANRLESGGEIIVTRPGGEATIHGRSVKITINSFPMFTLGHRYVLFLGHLSSDDTFESFGIGSFELADGAVTPFHADLSGIPSLKNESAFLAEVAAAIAAPCEHQSFPALGKRPEGL